MKWTHQSVMAGFIPAIHVLLVRLPRDVDARDKPGHHEKRLAK